MLKRLVTERTQIPGDEIRLIYAGKQMEDDKQLQKDYNYKNGQTMFLLLTLVKGIARESEKSGLEFTTDPW